MGHRVSFQSIPSDLSGVLITLDIIDIPAFVLTVDDSGDIRFGGLNRAHEVRTGMKGAEIAGLTPHEALPPRLADTVLANYRHCVDSNQTHRYEEVLDLPSGRDWWLTTLSPIVRDGRTVAVIGIAIDVTSLRTEISEAATDLGELRAQAANLQTLGRAVMAETRGPLNNILALGRLLRAEFRPPTTKKDEVLDLMMNAAGGALDQIDGFELESETAPAHGLRAASRVDLDHTCRDLAALIDPERTLSITFPEAVVLADASTLQTSLQALLETVAGRALTYIRISVTPDSGKPRMVRLSIVSDREEDTPRDDPAWLRAAVEARGGTLRFVNDPYADDNSMEVIELTLPGKLLSPAGRDNAARAVNQRQRGRASGL